MNKIIITHTADIQIKNRKEYLYQPTLRMLVDVERKVSETKSRIHVISGDLFEYAQPTMSEQKLIYNHLVSLLSIDTLEELVIIAGNHDLVKSKVQDNLESGNNAISTFASVVEKLPLGLSNKIRYFSKSGIFESRVDSNINYVVYSLEDEHCWHDLQTQIEPDKINLCLFHAMIREYATYDKLPIPEHVFNKLESIEMFPQRSLVLAGDIHKTLLFEGSKEQIFIYPGSTMQHTYSEGTYVTISDKPVTTEASNKFVFCYEANTDSKVVENITQIPLEQTINYLTVEFDSLLEPEHCVNELSLIKLDTVVAPIVVIKVKSNNKLVKHEREIKELLNQKFTENQTVLIDFVYDKLKSDSLSKSTGYVEQILEDKILHDNISIDTVLNREVINDLFLSQQQLSTLFDNCIGERYKTLDEDVKQGVLHLFEQEIQNAFEQGSKRYNISFEHIKADNFMYLKDIDVVLNQPGIVRILGTNGVGKTTLYRMIRWVITGMISEGMSASQSVKNNLLVFNKNLTDNDNVRVELNLTINDTKVRLVRSVERIWKQNTTDEQKLSTDKDEFVSKLNQSFEVSLNPDSEQVQTFTGKEAENVVISWFGNTINHLLFMNQSKIEQIITANATELKEMILRYLGVDYLVTLEERLPKVKDICFEKVSKPKRKADEIIDAMSQNESIMFSQQQQVEEIETKIQSINSQLETLENDYITVNNEFTKVYSDNEKRKSLVSTIEENQKELDKLPELASIDTVPYEQAVVSFKEKCKSLDDIILKGTNKLEEYETKSKQLTDDIKAFINTKLETINQQLEDAQQKLESISEEFKQASNKKNEAYKMLVDKYNSRLKKLKDASSDTLSEIQELEHDVKIKQKDIERLEYTIKSGYCDACKQMRTDFSEELKLELKQEISGVQSQIEQIKPKIEDKQQYHKKLEAAVEQFTDIVVKLENQTIPDNKKFEETEELQSYEASLNTLSESKQSMERDISRISNGRVILSVHNILHNPECIDESFEPFRTRHQEIVDIQTKIDNKIKATLKELKELKDNDTSQLELESVQKSNEKVVQRKLERNKFESIIEHSQNELSKLPSNLETTVKELGDKLNEIEYETRELNEDLDSLKSRKNTCQNVVDKRKEDVARLEQELKDCEAYGVQEFIWKIYNDIIGKGILKKLVFEYYSNFLNNTLNFLLEDVSFKLFWSFEHDLTMIRIVDGQYVYQSPKQASGMETTFLGLTLIYALHLLNIKNTVNCLFIDEISGTLNDGSNLSYMAENYQELFVKILSKFSDKTIFIVDHTIDSFDEVCKYEVVPNNHKTSATFVQVS